MPFRWFPALLLAFGCLCSPGHAQLVISEFLTRNVGSLADSNGSSSDWIELHNPTAQTINLAGWYLTDDPAQPTLWRFPNQTLAGGAYLVVNASGKNVTNVASTLHTNFKLGSTGGYLALVQPDGVTVASEYQYPAQFADVSFGRPVGATGPGVFYGTPTPRAANGTGWPTRAAEVQLSVPGGLFTNTFNVSLSSPQVGGQIRYTLDGTVPTENSTLYAGPIAVGRTLRLRARVFAPGVVPGPIAGAAYTQVGPTAQTRSSNLPILVLDTYGATIVPDSRSKGTVTVLIPNQGRTTLPGRVEVASRATFEIRGSSSTGFPKQSIGMELRGEDEADLPQSLLGLPAESDWVLYAPYTDKTLIRDVLAYELSNQLGRYAPRTRLVELYVNRSGTLDAADYQGVYVLIEKIKGGPGRVDIEELEATDYTQPAVSGGFILKKDRTDSNDAPFTTSRGQELGIEWPRARDLGTTQLSAIRTFMNQMESALYGPQYRNPQTGYQAYLDADSFIDHWWLVEVAKNIDGYRLSTFMFKDQGGKLNLGPIWDYNLSFGNADYLEGWKTNGWYWPQLGASDYPWFSRLFQDPDFTQRHADRWATLRTTKLTTSNVLQVINSLTNQLAEAQVRNFQRWPSFGRYIWPNWYIGNNYEDEIGFLKRWVTGRLAWIDTTVVKWPEMTPAAGYHPEGVTVTLKSSFPVFYTVDGTDPRATGGTLSPSARNYVLPVSLTNNTRFIARARNGSRWSPPVSATFVVTLPTVKVSELMYHPLDDPSGVYDGEEFEFLEVRNTGDEPVSLSGLVLSQGIQFTFPTNAGSLLPEEHAVVVRNTNAFAARYGDGVRVVGQYSGRLDNAGERLVFTGAWGEPIEDFTYDDAWEPNTDGGGHSLTRLFPVGGWQASAVLGGTPGRADVLPADWKGLRVVRNSTAALVFTFPAAAGQSYTLQAASDLTSTNWTSVLQILPRAVSGPIEMTVPDEVESSRVFRLVTPRRD